MSRVSSRAWSLGLSPWMLGIAWSIVPVWVPVGTIAAEPPQPPAQAQSQTETTEAAEAVPPTTTSNTISLTELTRPSLWWAKEQFSDRQRFGSQLIAAWAAYEGKPAQLGRVDFFVNRQLWSQLDYLERYTFIHEFGTVANSYGYNVRVFNERKEFLAAYTCNSSPIAGSPVVPVCNTTLDSSGKSGFRSRSPNPLAP
jgi:hypothetical protein